MSVSIALVGSGGAGVLTAGRMVLDGAARKGWFGMMTRSTGAQIRGGESAAMLRLASRPVASHDDRFDVLLALDWRNVDRFRSELPLDARSIIVADSAAGKAPETLIGQAPSLFEIPFADLAKGIEGGRANMVGLGALARLLGIEVEHFEPVLARALDRKGDGAVESARECVHAGFSAAEALSDTLRWLDEPARSDACVQPHRWVITGNEACGLGAVRGGVRFVAAYPITPATEVLEWLAPALGRLGGTLVQAEDELASINQCIGASFGGVPSLTATSGPGLALMTESLGLAVASETPIVVIDVMRAGPSTGIPTKSEQSDLNIALYGLHGDAPHLVMAPLGIADCAHTTQWAVHLAERLQTAAIVLSDQSLGQSLSIIDPLTDPGLRAERLVADVEADGQVAASAYARYACTDSGISPMAVPGTPGLQFTADGLSHDVTGTPSGQAEHHLEQLAKRRRKLETFDYGAYWAEISGDGERAVITWGSSAAAVGEAVSRLAVAGCEIRLIAIRLLSPAQPERLTEALNGVRSVMVVEQNESAQLYHHLRAYYDVAAPLTAYANAGPLLLRPQQIYDRIRRWTEESP